MTTQQIILWTSAYFAELLLVVWFTRATPRRVAGALVGGAVVGLYTLAAVVLCQAWGLWQVPIRASRSFQVMFYLGLVVSSAPIYLVTWRIARRFGARGLAAVIAIVAVIGPPRDYWIASVFPQWMVFSRGLAPILADAVTYVGFVAIGHAVMRLIAGPARADALARKPRTR
jgi:hypothetical protein